jgi:AhpC/TSA family protein
LGPRTLALAALLLALGTIVAFVALLSLLTISLRPAWYLSALALATALAMAAVWRARRWLTVSALVISVLLLACAGFFHFVAMRVPLLPTQLVVGQPAPDFTLPDAAGRAVRLSDYRGRQPVVLVFYRGYW